MGIILAKVFCKPLLIRQFHSIILQSWQKGKYSCGTTFFFLLRVFYKMKNFFAILII